MNASRDDARRRPCETSAWMSCHTLSNVFAKCEDVRIGEIPPDILRLLTLECARRDVVETMLNVSVTRSSLPRCDAAIEEATRRWLGFGAGDIGHADQHGFPHQLHQYFWGLAFERAATARKADAFYDIFRAASII